MIACPPNWQNCKKKKKKTLSNSGVSTSSEEDDEEEDGIFVCLCARLRLYRFFEVYANVDQPSSGPSYLTILPSLTLVYGPLPCESNTKLSGPRNGTFQICDFLWSLLSLSLQRLASTSNGAGAKYCGLKSLIPLAIDKCNGSVPKYHATIVINNVGTPILQFTHKVTILLKSQHHLLGVLILFCRIHHLLFFFCSPSNLQLGLKIVKQKTLCASINP